MKEKWYSICKGKVISKTETIRRKNGQKDEENETRKVMLAEKDYKNTFIQRAKNIW